LSRCCELTIGLQDHFCTWQLANWSLRFCCWVKRWSLAAEPFFPEWKFWWLGYDHV